MAGDEIFFDTPKLLEKLRLEDGMQHFLEWKAQLFDHVESCGLEWHPLDFKVDHFLDDKLVALLEDILADESVEDLDFESFAQELHEIFDGFAHEFGEDQADDALEIIEEEFEVWNLDEDQEALEISDGTGF